MRFEIRQISSVFKAERLSNSKSFKLGQYLGTNPPKKCSKNLNPTYPTCVMLRGNISSPKE